MKTINAVPESITRDQYKALMDAAGFDPQDIRTLEFQVDGIYATVFHRNPAGGRIINVTEGTYAKTRIFIPVVDDDVPDQVKTTQGAAA